MDSWKPVQCRPSAFPVRSRSRGNLWHSWQQASVSSQPSSGLDKRQATLQHSIRAEGDQGPVVRSLVSANRWLRGIKTNRFPWYLTLVSANHASSNPGQNVKPALVFRGKGNVSSVEKDIYDERVDVFFQQNAWMDEEAGMQWCSKTLFPGVGNSEQDKVIFGDNVRFQQSKEFHEAYRNEINATVYMLLENHTDKIQPINAGCGRMMKVKIAAAIDRWLETEDNFDKWHDKLSAKDRRILMTQWTGEAWSELKENK